MHVEVGRTVGGCCWLRGDACSLCHTLSCNKTACTDVEFDASALPLFLHSLQLTLLICCVEHRVGGRCFAGEVAEENNAAPAGAAAGIQGRSTGGAESQAGCLAISASWNHRGEHEGSAASRGTEKCPCWRRPAVVSCSRCL